jgi:hypothetical protein
MMVTSGALLRAKGKDIDVMAKVNAKARLQGEAAGAERM